eukprot:scaffold231329_cov21-Tisochrysis_lutea.AAC.1
MLLSSPPFQLPLWYETWWDNGIYPGQPIVDHMYGAMPANLTEVCALASLVRTSVVRLWLHEQSGCHVPSFRGASIVRLQCMYKV